MARMISDRAHRNGLAAAQKNAGELGELGRLLGGLDFAVVESCRQFDECDGYMTVYGDRVFAIEYPAADADHFAAACAAHGARIAIVLRDRDLAMPGDPAYRFDSC